MIEKQTLVELLEEVLRGTGIFRVDIRVDPGNRIHIQLDKMEGITIEDCARISRELETRLDRDREDFSLEVSSPGLDSPFRVPEQYRKNIGRMVSVQLKEGARVLGILKESDQTGIRLEIPRDRKGTGPESRTFDYSEISTTRVHVQF